MRKQLPKYPKYKDSGVEWIGEIPEGWQKRKFTRDFRIAEGQVDPRHEPYASMLLVAPNHIESGTGRLVATETASEQGAISGKYLCRKGDVIYSKIRPALAKATLAPENCLCSADMYPFSARGDFANTYLLWLLLSEEFTAWSVLEADRVAMPKLNRVTLSSLWIPSPDYGDQRAIVSFLDVETEKIDRLLGVRRRQIEVLREQRAAVIHRAVTQGLDPTAPMKDSDIEWLGEIPAHWDFLKIKRLTPVKRGASPRPIHDPKYFDDEGEYAWVRISDVTASHRYLETTTQTLSPLGASLSVKLNPGSLFVSICASVGKPVITRIKCCIHDGFVYFPSLRINPEYMFYLFASGEPYKGLGNWGTQLNLNTDIIGTITIPLPPPIEQEAIVAHTDHETAKIDTLIYKYERELELLAEYRSSLISHAVTGKIDVRGLVTAEPAII